MKRNPDSETWVYLGVIGILLGVAFISPILVRVWNSTIPTEKIVREIEVQGFKNILVTHRDNIFVEYKGCTREDGIALRFTANNSQGQYMTGLLACRGGASLFPTKGLTIHSDSILVK